MIEQSGGRRRAGALLVIVISGLLVAVATGGAVPGNASTAAILQPEVDNTVTRVDVHANGSATWTVEIRTRLASEQSVDEYEAFQKRFRKNTAQYLGPFQDRIERVVSNAANATGREMRAKEFSARTSIQELPRRWGIVTYEFTWTNFAEQQGESVVVGDVFQGGFYLDDGDILVVSPPQGYAVTTVEPTPAARENETVRWRGPIDFSNERPTVRYEPKSSTESASGTPATGTGLPLVPILLGAVLLAVGGVVLFRTRGPGRSSIAASNESTGRTDESAGTLTDEERVREVLRATGGRVKQSELKEELGWSASKTSRVLASMADDGAVEKLRLGRENLVALPDDER